MLGMLYALFFPLYTLAVAAVRDHEFSSYINHFVSYSGFTPLHYAVISDDIAIIRLLLSHGADPTVEDRRGLTPVDYCTNEDVRILLKDHAAQVSSLIYFPLPLSTLIHSPRTTEMFLRGQLRRTVSFRVSSGFLH